MDKKVLLLFLLASELTWSQTSTTNLSSPIEAKDDDVIYVIGSQEEVFYTPGSATFIDSKDLEKFSYQDVGRVLDKVPGVYIQEEDGLGLRPNIGLRGAHPHRSKKVTLMEDGILVGPAPYAAPAAYYFPSMSRINSMEVFKGPSSVQYGPNSVGGALNMITAPLFGAKENTLEISGGTFSQYNLITRGQKEGFGWLLEVNRKEGELLRTLRNGETVDFNQNDVLLKVGQKLETYNQEIKLKLSYATEDSDETYLGTSVSDFNNNPFERYAASQDDNMKWNRWAAQASYSVKPTSLTKVSTTVYHHQMDRSWFKFNNFVDARNVGNILSGTTTDNDNITGLLRGDRDSLNSNEALLMGSNDRKFFSQGIQTKTTIGIDSASMSHSIDIGLRIHRDQVSRNHNEVQANMIGGDLVYTPNTYNVTNKNEDTSSAIAVFLQDEVIAGNLTAKIGARFEEVQHQRDKRDGSNLIENSERVFVPGIGFNYSVTPDAVILAGVNKGVTLVGPGQATDIEPEEAINYEAGFRIKAPIYAEAIAFYSDYKNLKGACSFSAGCDEANLDTAFNGGAGEIYGLESVLSHTFDRGAWRFPVKLGYTFTVARFKTSFANSNPEWGPTTGPDNLIRVNDPLPYIPQNQVSLGTGFEYRDFAMDLNFLWKDQIADQSVAEGRRIIPSYGTIDSSFSYRYSSKGKAFLRVNNLLDNAYLTSLRPFGLRPGSPRTFVAGLTQSF